MTIGNEIAAANKALEPPQAALIIYRQLFETEGGQRMSAANKFIAVGVITGGLIEWKRQLLTAQSRETEVWRKRYEDTKAELDDVRLKLALLQKEQ